VAHEYGGDEAAVAVDIAGNEVHDLVEDDPEDLVGRSTAYSRQKPTEEIGRSRSDGGGDDVQAAAQESEAATNTSATEEPELVKS
jgi:hypothetical protein